MDSSEKRVLAVSGHEQLPIDLSSCGQELNKEIVNQYGQLMGEYSKLDDELWLTAPEDEEAMGFCHEGLEWKIVSSHPLEHSADLQLSEHADNSLTGGGMTSMNHSSQNQSCSFSPVSILKRKSFSNEATFVMKRGQSKHRHPAKECSRFRSANCSCPNSLVRTRKITDLLQLHSEEKSPNPNPEKIRQQNPQTELVKKCSRCDSAKTPQWRDGPMGRKTLCNACGIQYKKGLLSAYYRPLTTLKPQTPVVKTCVYCESAITPQWRDSPLGRKTLCNACGIQYKKGLLSPDYRPLTTLKPQTQVVKKCVHCESAITPQWRDGPLGRKTLCNACGIHYKKGLLSPDYRPMRTPRFDTSLPTHLPMDSAKNPFFDPYQKKVQEMIMAENSEIDHNCARKSKIIQDMTEETSDMLDSDSNSDPDFKLTPRRKLPKVGDKKCAHCQSTKTPQWREGPLGRKTLCNACGVQYRNGRLFPEYRPLQSPTYDPSVHSHLPKRVEQMRMRKLCEERATSEKIEHPA